MFETNYNSWDNMDRVRTLPHFYLSSRSPGLDDDQGLSPIGIQVLASTVFKDP